MSNHILPRTYPHLAKDEKEEPGEETGLQQDAEEAPQLAIGGGGSWGWTGLHGSATPQGRPLGIRGLTAP